MTTTTRTRRTRRKKPTRTPATTPAAREKRDALILDLFLAGHTQRQIAANPQVKLTGARVNGIINTELERVTKDHILRNENAMIIYLARMEMLVREAFSQVNDKKDLKAIEVARRLMADQAKINGLADDDMRSPIPPMGDNELEEGEPMDELARYRSQRKVGGA